MLGHSFALTASLFVGQVQDVQIVGGHSGGSCGCESSSPFHGFSRSRAWTWQGPAMGSSWSAQERPIISRIQGLFRGNSHESYGSNYVSYSSGAEIAGGSCCGQQNPLMPPAGAGSYVPVINNQGPQIPHIQPLPLPSSPAIPQIENLKRMPTKVSLSEPPLLDKGAPGDVKTASFNREASPVVPLPAQAAPSGINPKYADKIGHEENYLWVSGQLAVEQGSHTIHFAPASAGDRFGGKVTIAGQIDLSNFQDGDLVTVRGSVIPGPNGINFYRVSGIDLIERASR